MVCSSILALALTSHSIEREMRAVRNRILIYSNGKLMVEFSVSFEYAWVDDDDGVCVQSVMGRHTRSIDAIVLYFAQT